MTRKREASRYRGSLIVVMMTECDQCGQMWDERTSPRPSVEMRRSRLISFGDPLGETRTFCDTTCAEAWLVALNAKSESANPR
jgi:hypothetical protein